jgi:hypothetical protein
MNTRKMVAALGFAIALAGCEGWEVSTSSYSTGDISIGNPSGVVGGAPWSMSMASVRNDGGYLDIALYAEPVETCSFGSSDKPMLMFKVPATVDSYSVDFSQRLTFVEAPAYNTIADGGFIDVKSVSDTSVVIGLIVDAGEGYSVNGTFVAEVCP